MGRKILDKPNIWKQVITGISSLLTLYCVFSICTLLIGIILELILKIKIINTTLSFWLSFIGGSFLELTMIPSAYIAYFVAMVTAEFIGQKLKTDLSCLSTVGIIVIVLNIIFLLLNIIYSEPAIANVVMIISGFCIRSNGKKAAELSRCQSAPNESEENNSKKEQTLDEQAEVKDLSVGNDIPKTQNQENVIVSNEIKYKEVDEKRKRKRRAETIKKKIKRRDVAIVTLAILLFFSVSLSSYLFFSAESRVEEGKAEGYTEGYAAAEKKLKDAEKKLEDIESSLKTANERVKNLEARNDRLSNKLEYYYYHAGIVSGNGKYYHRYGCEDANFENFYIYNIELASAKGYDPCPNCFDNVWTYLSLR